MSVPNAARDAAHGGTVTHPMYTVPQHTSIAPLHVASAAPHITAGQLPPRAPTLAPPPTSAAAAAQQPFVPLPASPPVPSPSAAAAGDVPGASGIPKGNKKQKINISYIDDNRKRQVSFCKRKNGAMKKGMELNLMTGSMIGIFVFNPANGWYHEFGTHDPVEIFRAYASFTGPSERRRDSDFFDEYEAALARAEEAAHTTCPVDSNPEQTPMCDNLVDDLSFFDMPLGANGPEFTNSPTTLSPLDNPCNDKLFDGIPAASNSSPHLFDGDANLPQNEPMNTNAPVSASIEALLSPETESPSLTGHPKDRHAGAMNTTEMLKVPPPAKDIPTAASVPALEDEIGWNNAITDCPLVNLPWNPTGYTDQMEAFRVSANSETAPDSDAGLTLNLPPHIGIGNGNGNDLNSQPSLYYPACDLETYPHPHLHPHMPQNAQMPALSHLHQQHPEQVESMYVDQDNANNFHNNIVGKKRHAPQCVENPAKVHKIT